VVSATPVTGAPMPSDSEAKKFFWPIFSELQHFNGFNFNILIFIC